MAASSASCCWSTCSSARSTRSPRCSRPIPRASPASAASPTLIDTEPDIADRPGARGGHRPAGRHRLPRRAASAIPPSGRCSTGSTSTIRAGETVAFVGPSGAGKTTHLLAAAALLRGHRRVDHHRRHRHPRHDAGLAAPPDRHRAAGCVPVRRHHPREHRLWPARRQRRGDHRGRCAAPRSTR